MLCSYTLLASSKSIQPMVMAMMMGVVFVVSICVSWR